MRATILCAFAAASVLAYAGAAAANVKFALAAPVTGPNAVYGQEYEAGVKTAVDQINESGGVLGERIDLIVGDDASDPRQGVSVANGFVGAGARFVIGHFNSGVTIPSSLVYSDNGMLFVTPTSTNPNVTDRGLWDAFRACGRDDQQGRIAAAFLLRNYRDRRVAIVDDKTTAGRGLADEMRKAYRAGGAREVLSEEINAGEKDYTSLVVRLKAVNAEIVYYGGLHTEAGLIVRQMHDQGVKAVLMGGDGISSQEFSAISGPAGEGTLMTSFPDPARNPEASEAVARLKAHGVPPETITLFAYGATQIIAEGIRKSRSLDPRAVAAYLHSGATIDTILGPISFDAKGDILQPTFVVFTWRSVDGAIKPVQNP